MPQLVMRWRDQFDNASRISQLGLRQVLNWDPARRLARQLPTLLADSPRCGPVPVTSQFPAIPQHTAAAGLLRA